MADVSLRTSAPALSFQSTTFSVVDRNGQRWLQAADIARALGYGRADKVGQIYDRHADEFTPGMTETLKLRVTDSQTLKSAVSSNLQREVRMFSLRGAHLLAMFARTPVAKEFRRWVLDVLDQEVKSAAPVSAPVPPTPNPKEQDDMRALIKATRKQFALVEKQFAAWEVAHPVVQPAVRSLRGTIEQAQRKADGSWALYVLCGDVALGVAVSQGCAPRGGLKAGDQVRMEYAPDVNPLTGRFSRVSLIG